jgi:hypothetical protein
MSGITLHLDDYIPRMRDAGLLRALEKFAITPKSPSDIESWFASQGYAMPWQNIVQFISDCLSTGDTTSLVLEGETLPTPDNRPSVVSGLGCANGNVWFGTPNGAALAGRHFRFYVNGYLKTTLVAYYITSLADIGAGSGNVVQICEVADGIVGWWTRIVVP